MTLLSNFILFFIAQTQPVCSHHFYVSIVMVLSHSVMSNSTVAHQALRSMGLPTRLLGLWDFQDKSAGVDFHFLLQGIFLTQGLNPCLLCLLHSWQILYPLSHQESPGGDSGKEPTCKCRTCKRHGFNPWEGKISCRKTRQPTLVFLLGESHG